MTNAILRGQSDAGNPHVRFDEGEVASTKPRRGSPLCKKLLGFLILPLAASVAIAEDAYIEATGTQGVPIRYYANTKTRYEVDFQFTEAPQARAIVGNWVGSGLRLSCWANNSSMSIEGCVNGSYSGALVKADTDRHTLVLDATTWTMKLITGRSEASKSIPSGAGSAAASAPVVLFACPTDNDGGINVKWQAKARIYRFKIFEDDELVRDLVPCVKEDLVGFYDLLNGEFFTDPVHGNLTAGGDDVLILTESDDDAFVSSPTGGVTIDTGFKMTPDTCLDIDFVVLDDQSASQFLFETSNRYDGNLCSRVYVNSSLGYSFCCENMQDGEGNFLPIGNPDASGTHAKIAVKAGVRHRAIIDSYNSEVTFMSYGITNSHFSIADMVRTNSTNQLTTRLLSSSYSGSFGSTAKARIYGFKVYEKGVLVHDYQPRKYAEPKDAAICGMFKDMVNLASVLPGSSGSTASKNLSYGGKITEDPYVESKGDQIIVLDYVPNMKTYLEMDYAFTESGTAETLLGAAQGSQDNAFAFRLNSNGNQEYRIRRVWSGNCGGKSDSRRHTAVMDIPEGFVHCRTGMRVVKSIDCSAKSGYGEMTPLRKLGVFANNVDDSTYDNPCKARVYGIRVYEDGELVRNYEPFVRNGRAGFKDALSGSFADGLNAGTESLIAFGGNIAYDGPVDAYVESDGTQAVPTDYCVGPNSRIELDFMPISTGNKVVLAGSTVSSGAFFWRNKGGNMEFCLDSEYQSTGLAAKLMRCTASIDVPTLTGTYVQGATTKGVTFSKQPTATSTCPMALFANQSRANVFSYFAAMRIYSFRIKEKEGDAYVLKHEYLPFQSGDIVGFVDTQTQNIITNAVTGANPLKVGGMGVDGSGDKFLLEVQDTTIESDGSGVLTAYAPGATAYRWTLDGKVVEGETGAQLNVPWMRRPRTRPLTVTPIYNVFGTTVEGEMIEATLTNEPYGLALIVQ